MMGKWFLDADDDINIIQLGLLFTEKFPQYAPHIVTAHCGWSKLLADNQAQPRPVMLIKPIIDCEILARNPFAEIKNG